ncbi:hypothetical protein D9M69_389640 [compost metagenome]
MFGDDQAGIRARRADRAGQLRHDAAGALGGRGQGDDGQAATAARGAAQEVHRATHGADIDPGGHFGIHLSGQVDLDRRVDRRELVDAGQHLGVMRVAGFAQLQLRVAVGPAAQALAAHQDAADADAGIDALARVGQHAGLGQRGNAVPDRAAVQAQVAAVMQRGHHGLGQVADAHLQRGAILHPARDMARDRLLRRAGGAALQADRRMRGIDQQVDLVRGEVAAAIGPWHFRVHLGDNHAGPVQRRGNVLMHQAHAVAACLVGRRHLHQHYIGAQRAVADQAGQVRIVARHDVQHAGPGQRAVRAAGGIAEEIDRVGLHRLQRVGLADADKHAEPPALRERVAVPDQRARQRQRLGGGLAPPDMVAGAQQCLQRRGQFVVIHGSGMHGGRCGIRRSRPSRG